MRIPHPSSYRFPVEFLLLLAVAVALPLSEGMKNYLLGLYAIGMVGGLALLSLYHGTSLWRQFRVATGQSAYPTPAGRFDIIVKWKNPWWYPPASPWAAGEKPTPPGPWNPLGTRWMGLSAPGVGIHGTPKPQSIGYSESHGCIRMLIPQAEWLFDHVDVGTTVFIV